MSDKIKLKEILDKYFPEGKNRNKYFHSSDAHKNIEGDTYLYYKWHGVGYVELYAGGDNAEYCITVTDDADKIEMLIKNIIR